MRYQAEKIGELKWLEHVMPTKTISKKIYDELADLDIHLLDTRPAVLCPYCFEVHQEENVAPAIEDKSHIYVCGTCELMVSLQ